MDVFPLMPGRSLEKLKGKAPQLIVIAIVVVVIAVVLFATLEDMLIEGSTFGGTQLGAILNAILMFTQYVTAAISSWGYAGIFVLMFLESTSLPIPSEAVLPFSGYLVSLGLLNLWLAILVSTLAGILGSLVDYYIGMKGANLLARRISLDKLFFGKARMEMAQNWFHKYGALAIFLSRLVPGFRTLISFPAGAVKMPLLKFIAYTTGGCLVWNALLIYIGMYVGSNWREVTSISRYLIIIILAAILVAFTVFLIKKKMKTQSKTRFQTS
jgi:membrane protein DedA with SNARE-associated domain